MCETDFNANTKLLVAENNEKGIDIIRELENYPALDDGMLSQLEYYERMFFIEKDSMDAIVSQICDNYDDMHESQQRVADDYEKLPEGKIFRLIDCINVIKKNDKFYFDYLFFFLPYCNYFKEAKDL